MYSTTNLRDFTHSSKQQQPKKKPLRKSIEIQICVKSFAAKMRKSTFNSFCSWKKIIYIFLRFTQPITALIIYEI